MPARNSSLSRAAATSVYVFPAPRSVWASLPPIRDSPNWCAQSDAHRLERCGYVRARNPDADDGLWKIGDRRQAVYARAVLSFRDQLAAVHVLLGQSNQ